MHESRRVLPHLEWDRPQVLAGDQGIVDQVSERDRLERGTSRPQPAFGLARREANRP